MASVTIEDGELVVRLSPLEKLGAFHGDVRVPLSAVQSITVEADPWGVLRGVRAPGTGVPGLVAYGVRRFPGGKDFAAVRGRRPAVRVDLGAGAPFARLLVSVADADAEVARLPAVGGP
jgi:hypothetical protein